MEPAEQAKWQMIQHCWAVGQWERMEALGRDLLLTQPAEAEFLHAVGVAVFQLGRREEAAELFRQAVVNDPDHAPSHAMMGWYWARRKKFGRAEECLQRAIRIEPGNDQFWVWLGRILLLQGNGRGARICAGKALGLNPDNASAVALEADVEVQGDGIGRSSTEERRKRIEAALSREPENADLHAALGEVCEAEGRLREAEERFRESLALDPSRPWLWGKVRRMGLKRDRIDNVLSAPWRLGLWLLREGEIAPLFLGLLVCALWGLVLGPVSFLYRLMFRIELEFLAARGTREVSVSLGRRLLRLGLLAVAAGSYWSLCWWVAGQGATWVVAKWVLLLLGIGLAGAGVYFGIREVAADSRHRRTLRDLEDGRREP